MLWLKAWMSLRTSAYAGVASRPTEEKTMTADVDHNKLIKQTANAVLKPHGLLQKGTSRIWIDDNGWYLTVVEFQPSSWDKGTYLNVGINYLWNEQECLSFDYGHRVGTFVSFKGNEEESTAKLNTLSETALEKAEEYRRFRDLGYAKRRILATERKSNKTRSLYNSLMICGLCRDRRALRYYKKLSEHLLHSQFDWEKAYTDELTERIGLVIGNADLLYTYVCEKIERQRTFWRSKSSMKKLAETFTLN